MASPTTPKGAQNDSDWWNRILAQPVRPSGSIPSVHNATLPIQTPLRRNNSEAGHGEWRQYSFAEVHVADLPLDVTTQELYTNFKRWSNIDQIQIRDDRGNSELRRADIRYKPPPAEPFWEFRRRHTFTRSDGTDWPRGVYVVLSNTQKRHFTHPSRLQKGVLFNDETMLVADSVEFGLQLSPTCFLSKRLLSSKKDRFVTLTLRLHRNEITIQFGFDYYSDSGKKTDSLCRMIISLDQKLSIFKVKGKENSFSLILNLESPPPYTRLVDNMALQFDPQSRQWREDDAWLRQTDLARTKSDIMDIRKTPISLQPSALGIVALGRWLTYRLTFSGSKQNTDAVRIFALAVGERNTEVVDVDKVDIVREKEPVWQLLKTLSKPDPSLSKWEQSLLRLELPFSVWYRLEVCVSNGWLNEYNLDESFVRALNAVPERVACRILENVASRKKKITEPMKMLLSAGLKMPKRKTSIPTDCVIMHSATVTATTIRVNLPSVELSNRVVRQYKNHCDRFLRIRFEDDHYRGNSRIYAETSSKMNEIFVRIKRTLLKGVNIAGRHYEFLAWGNSQLREHGAYFFAALPGIIDASQIRAVLGQFDHEKIIAKRAARIGQCFSTTKSIPGRMQRVSKHDIEDIQRNGYIFTDGVGKISPLLAAQVASLLKIKGNAPSVLQFRLGGCKGVLAVAPELTGRDVKIRASQFKFPCDSDELEIIRPSEFWNAYLNRQLILVLSALGVPTSTFTEMQKAEIDALNGAIESDTAAVQALYDRVDPNRMTPVIASLVSNGFRGRNEPFVMSLLHLWRAWNLKYLKEKAHLYVTKGALLLGCVDEMALLAGYFNDRQPGPDATEEEKMDALPEIFVQVTLPRTGECKVIRGTCIIARNPSLHLGDIRVVRAVDKPELRHLRDVLVLPQTGDRDLSSMCSGGDLDGDDYIVIWDQRLIPTNWTAKPFHYESPTPVRAEREVTVNDFIQFFHQYIKNDFLGKIATAHMAWADRHEDGIQSPQCLELTRLHSMAVDYPKTGVPARLPRNLEGVERPHFMQRPGRVRPGKSYRSLKVLGKLYDGVQSRAFNPQYELSPDKHILNCLTPSQDVLRVMAELKEEYDEAILRIMTQHEIKTEFEVWSTFILDHSKAQNTFKFHEEIGQLSQNLKHQFYEAIVEKAGGRDHTSLAPYAVAAYKLTAEQFDLAKVKADDNGQPYTSHNMPFISFPWVLYEVLGSLDPGDSMNGDLESISQIPQSLVHGLEILTNGTEKKKSQPPSNTYAMRNRLTDPYQPIPGDNANIPSGRSTQSENILDRTRTVSSLSSTEIKIKNGQDSSQLPRRPSPRNIKLPPMVTKDLLMESPPAPQEFVSPSVSDEPEDSSPNLIDWSDSADSPFRSTPEATPRFDRQPTFPATDGSVVSNRNSQTQDPKTSSVAAFSDPANDQALLAQLLAANLDEDED